MDFLRLFQHLLPDGRAWRTTVNKRLSQFFTGLKTIPDGVKEASDSVWLDLLPESTDKLTEWEREFGLPRSVLTENDRRLRLAATWRALIGGQSPRYIQDTLQAAGFNVYVHEWWWPSAPDVGCGETLAQCGENFAQCGNSIDTRQRSSVILRDPRLFLRRRYIGITPDVGCGEALALCGEAFAQAGNSTEPLGYPLVNKTLSTRPFITALCGEAFAQAGSDEMVCGNFAEYRTAETDYTIPNDPIYWPFFLYIGGRTFGSLAQVDPNRRDEFEALCLKICPTQQWLGMLVTYI